MADDAREIAFDPYAPDDERMAAHREMTRAAMPTAADLIPVETIAQIQESMDILKSAQVLQFPGERRIRAAPNAMRSVRLDDQQVAMQGGYYDRPGSLTPDMMRSMVRRTPILAAIMLTRQRQVMRFCAPSEDGGLGFAVRHVDKTHELAPEEEASIRRLTRFFQHCGFEWNPRKRKKLKRDSFPNFMAKLVADSLTMDAASIETVMKRDASLGIDGLIALDGATIRLCPEDGYEGNPEITAVQVVNGRVTTAYDTESLIYEPRNPQSDVAYGGYGFGELELLIQTITGFLNAMTLNIAGFNKNSIPRGLLTLAGDYGDSELAAFKRYLQAMTRGAENAFAMPVMVSKDPQGGKATYQNFGVEFNEMYFSKWMTFLTSMACAIYGMAPDEINFESFSNGPSSLSGSDTDEKLAASKDKGLRPLLSYFEQTFTDFIVTDFSDKYCFRWIGLDEEDEKQAWEGRKLTLTVDELRAQQGEPPHPIPEIGAAPLNHDHIALYQATINPQGQDFGGGGGDFGDPNADDLDDDEGGNPGDEDDQPPGGAGDGGDPAAGRGDNGGPGFEMPRPRGAAPDLGKAMPVIHAIGG